MILGTLISQLGLANIAKMIGMMYAIATSQIYTGIGTQFGPSTTDVHNVDGPACLLRRPPLYAREMIKNGNYVAHKSMKCHQLIYICVARTQRCAQSVVADWGPRHSEIDLFAGLAKKLRHNGKEQVAWITINPPEKAK